MSQEPQSPTDASPSGDAPSYYAWIDGEAAGPFTASQLRNRWAVGRVAGDTLVFRGEPGPDSEWQRLDEVFPASGRDLNIRKDRDANRPQREAEEPMATPAQKSFLIKHRVSHSGVIGRLTEKQAAGMIRGYRRRKLIRRMILLLVLLAAAGAGVGVYLSGGF